MISAVSSKSVATLTATLSDAASNKSAATPNTANLIVNEFIKASEIIRSNSNNCQLDNEITDEELLEAALMLEAKNAATNEFD